MNYYSKLHNLRLGESQYEKKICITVSKKKSYIEFSRATEDETGVALRIHP